MIQRSAIAPASTDDPAVMASATIACSGAFTNRKIGTIAAKETKPSGGMATVWVGAARGGLGFRQLVAIKRPHPHLVERPEYRRELVAEARLASLIHHANVVDVRDVEVDDGQISLVMDYVEGASLGELLVAASKRGERIPAPVVVRIVLDALAGLHAAHEAKDERGRPIGLIHRDISPQNVLVGIDGVGRVADFGVAKLTDLSTTHGALKGKLGYMPPEYLRGEKIDRRFDVFAMGVVLWECLCGKRLFKGEHDADTFNRILTSSVPRVSEVVPQLGGALDSVVEVALAKSRDERFDNASAMASALETCAREVGLVARHAEVAEAVETLVGPMLAERRDALRKKLALEPSVLSLMSADRVDLPEAPRAVDRPTVPEGTRASPDAVTHAAPAPAPSHGMPATTLPLAGAPAQAPPPAFTGFESTQEPSRGFEPMEVSTVPSRGGLRALAIALVAAVVVGGAATAWLVRDRGTQAPPPPASTARPTPTESAPPPSASVAATTAPPPSASAAKPLPHVVPPHVVPPQTRPTAHGTAAPPRASAPSTATGGPPPNPYVE
jgi:serine/threonine-protein kinase